MVPQTERYQAFVKLGAFLREVSPVLTGTREVETSDDPRKIRFLEVAERAVLENGWFTLENIQQALAAWGEVLRPATLEKWLSGYPARNGRPGNIAIIMAGNIPLVGFHDFLSVLLLGHRAEVKLASADRLLLPLVADYLATVEPALQEAFSFTEGPLKEYDAVIATGSNNTARYFEYYFGKKPHIIRRNRNSVAILNGDESREELQALGKDIFTYFGLGCRNVSKLFVPENYDFKPFFEAIEVFSEITGHRKYANNYEYNKAVYLMSAFPFLDNGFLLLREEASYASPIGTLYYEPYQGHAQLQGRLEADRGQVQCIVGRDGLGITPFGQTQHPALWDYADGVDTVDFLLKT